MQITDTLGANLTPFSRLPRLMRAVNRGGLRWPQLLVHMHGDLK